jgi:hypothetical protein
MSVVGGESYSNMWTKVQIIWTYVARNWLRTNRDAASATSQNIAEENKYDWFMMMGDDTYVNVDNLK